MPGVSSTESAEIIVQLQEVGQIISQETSQLVDALVNLTVDQEDTDKAIARMGLETSLTKAESEDKAQTIRDLGSEVETERKKREQAENDVKKVMRDLHDLTEDFKRVKDKAAKRNEGGGASCDVRDDMIKVQVFLLLDKHENMLTKFNRWKTKYRGSRIRFAIWRIKSTTAARSGS
jgi:hypothetical protein